MRVASPRVLKPGEEKIVDFLLRLRLPDPRALQPALLEALRDRDARRAHRRFQPQRRQRRSPRTNFSSSACNVITPTHDLNAAQVADLARQVGGDRIEAVAYQHLPVFHTEHCVFCRFLSNGTSYQRLRPSLRKHRVALRDTRAARTR